MDVNKTTNVIYRLSNFDMLLAMSYIYILCWQIGPVFFNKNKIRKSSCAVMGVNNAHESVFSFIEYNNSEKMPAL